MKFDRILVCLIVGSVLVACSRTKEEVATVDPPKAATQEKPSTDEKIQNGLAMGTDELSSKQGIPLYPGATAPEGQSTVTKGNGESNYKLVLLTNDPFKKVESFYDAKLPKVSSVCNSSGCDMMGPTPKGTLAHIKIIAKDGKTTIEVSVIVEDAGKK